MKHLLANMAIMIKAQISRALIGLILIDNKQTDTFSYFHNVMTQLSIINGTDARKTNAN